MLMISEWQVNFVAGIIKLLERDGYSRIDTSEEAEGWWAEEVDMVSQYTRIGSRILGAMPRILGARRAAL